ncbi:MAG TPA: sulfotransferase [Cytophagaceae bacterium]
MSLNIFFIIGAQRSGTSYLRQVLDEHPQIEMAKPFRPEPKFFMNEVSPEDKANYLNTYFSKEAQWNKILGEKSTSYLESVVAAKGIRQLFPQAKILVCLRNPVERAISNYYYSYSNGLETRTLEEVFLQNVPAPVVSGVSVSPFDYVKRGEYVNYLKIYDSYFKEGLVKVLLFEELMGNLSAIQSVYSFLGAEAGFVPKSLDQKINEGVNKLEIPPKLVELLKAHYRPYNQELMNAYGIDTGIWN